MRKSSLRFKGITMSFISIVTPTYNEQENVEELYERIKKAMSAISDVTYEHIFIDNASKDGTVAILRKLAARDPNVKVIVNVRNFGHIRSPHHALLQATGDAVVLMASDLQDPPELLAEFIQKWREGYKVVMAVRTESVESVLLKFVRTAYYDFIGNIADVPLTKNYTGFGLYDRAVMDIIRKIDDPYPYFRGLVAELGFEPAKVMFHKPGRKRGFTKNNFFTLYDIAMLGITSHSKVPLRLATMSGFALGVLSLITAFLYVIAKLIFWNQFTIGLAPIIIALFFFSSMQLFFVGILGEYLGFIYTQILKRPLVVERERINF